MCREAGRKPKEVVVKVKEGVAVTGTAHLREGRETGMAWALDWASEGHSPLPESRWNERDWSKLRNSHKVTIP